VGVRERRDLVVVYDQDRSGWTADPDIGAGEVEQATLKLPSRRARTLDGLIAQKTNRDSVNRSRSLQFRVDGREVPAASAPPCAQDRMTLLGDLLLACFMARVEAPENGRPSLTRQPAPSANRAKYTTRRR
jgi:hypothetical protein